MNRKIITTNFGETLLHNTVRIEAEPSRSSGQEGFRTLMELLQTLCYQPDLLRHGSDCPETLKAYHDGTHWVIETTTVVPNPKVTP